MKHSLLSAGCVLGASVAWALLPLSCASATPSAADASPLPIGTPDASTLPEATTPQGGSEDTLEACMNRIDDDGNGFVDCFDQQCYSRGTGPGASYCKGSAAAENTIESCWDGIDNDGNGFIDCADFGCTRGPSGVLNATCEVTNALCSDGLDNDGNGYIDCQDITCRITSVCKTTETDNATCSDGVDNDGDGKADCADPDCAKNALVTVCSDAGAGTFAGALPIDDSTIGAIDPNSLPALAEAARKPTLAYVQSVADGDTMLVNDGDAGLVSVRIVGVNSPEIAHGDKPADCYGNEATAFTKQLAGHYVWLTFGETLMDPYGRTLAYVHLNATEAGFFQRQLLRRGFAKAYVFTDNDGYRTLFESDDAIARSAKVGMWGACGP